MRTDCTHLAIFITEISSHTYVHWISFPFFQAQWYWDWFLPAGYPSLFSLSILNSTILTRIWPWITTRGQDKPLIVTMASQCPAFIKNNQVLPLLNNFQVIKGRTWFKTTHFVSSRVFAIHSPYVWVLNLSELSYGLKKLDRLWFN